jgi:hypothetical protein
MNSQERELSRPQRAVAKINREEQFWLTPDVPIDFFSNSLFSVSEEFQAKIEPISQELYTEFKIFLDEFASEFLLSLEKDKELADPKRKALKQEIEQLLIDPEGNLGLVVEYWLIRYGMRQTDAELRNLANQELDKFLVKSGAIFDNPSNPIPENGFLMQFFKKITAEYAAAEKRMEAA